jgi:hypothetical protein
MPQAISLEPAQAKADHAAVHAIADETATSLDVVKTLQRRREKKDEPDPGACIHRDHECSHIGAMIGGRDLADRRQLRYCRDERQPRFTLATLLRSLRVVRPSSVAATCACCIWPEDRLNGCELPSRHCCWRLRSTRSRMSPTGMTRHHLRQPIALPAAIASRSTVSSTRLGTIILRSP